MFYVPTSIYIYICISSQENDHIFIDYENSGDIYDAYCINLYCIQTITRIVGILIDMMHTVYLLYMYIHNIYIVTHIYCTYIHIYIYIQLILLDNRVTASAPQGASPICCHTLRQQISGVRRMLGGVKH